ncbi:MAG: mechanosensitive ion channel family protein [Cyanothece sp. SIO1E1]|nr:mechanosensitive ion channel family protein [Cyanothece sp. SIO1E1]
MGCILKTPIKRLIILAVTLFLSVILQTFAAAQDRSVSSDRAEPAPVTLAGETLFFIPTGLNTFSPAERARAISFRIEAIAKDASVQIDDLMVEDQPDMTRIAIDGVRVLVIRDADAEVANQTRQELAAEYLQNIQAGIQQYRQQRDLRQIFIGLLRTFVATVSLVLLLKLSPIFSKLVYPSLRTWRKRSLAASRAQNIESPWVEVADILLILAKIIRFIVIGALFYVYVTVVLRSFPRTKSVGNVLGTELLDSLYATWKAIAGYWPNLFQIALFLFISHFTLQFIRVAFTALERRALSIPGFYSEWAKPTYTLTRFIVLALTVAVVVPYLPGYGSGAFQAVSLFTGVLVSLGSASAINNVISGIILIYTRGFQVGDRVEIGNAIGEVIDQTLLVTRIKTIKNVRITIPNSNILNGQIVNFSALGRETDTPLILHTTITLGYDIPWQQVHQVLTAAARSTQFILQEPAPFIWQTSLDDFYVSYELNAYTDKSESMAAIYAELHQHIQDHCHQAGIEIMSPHYSAVRDGNQSTMPQQYLPKGYEPSGFRVFPLNQSPPS